MKPSAGLLVAALGALAWVWANVQYDSGPIATLGTLVVAVGMLGAAVGLHGADRRSLGALGFLLGALGILLFAYDVGLELSISSTATVLFLLGTSIAAGAAFRWAKGNADAGALRPGLIVAALACGLWVVSDGLDEAWAWQPGNVAVGLGLLCAATALPSVLKTER